MKINHEGCYQSRRAREYPSIQDQLDYLWHSMNQGVLPKAEPFYSEIKGIKEKYPKQESRE